jgi:hypothetical protein
MRLKMHIHDITQQIKSDLDIFGQFGGPIDTIHTPEKQHLLLGH